jgi:uncharacterized protein (DUF433 family)
MKPQKEISRIMTWKTYIHADPKILLGKPVIKGTRLSVEFILGLFSEGWTEPQVLASYPTLTPESIQAIFAFAADCLKEDVFYLPLLSAEAS